jgi:hypothetical protein
MSNLEPSPPAPPRVSSPPPPGMGGCMVAFLVLVGVVLLLPGICSLIFMGFGGLGGGGQGGIVGLMFLTFLIAAGGVALIVFAIRNRRAPAGRDSAPDRD